MRWMSRQPRMPEQGDRELRKGQRQSEAEHPGEKNSGVPFMNGGDHVRASGHRQCRRVTASGRGDLALQPKCCEGVVDGALVIVAARHMNVCRGGMQGGGDFDIAQRVTGPHDA